MRQHILATALAAAVTALAYGQNLNPTVEVTNAYEGGASSISKPVQQMAVPDSVLKFNLDFDYSVFEKPYQGAYEFKPYYVQLKPAPKMSTEEKFFLRVGAGYTLHPELDLVWTPLRKEKFQMNVYATHYSYFGRYHQFDFGDFEDGVSRLKATGEKMKGYLADTKVGVDGTYCWDGGVATLDVAYRHRMAKDDFLSRRIGGVEASGRVRSLPSDEPHFLYDAAVKYHYLGGAESSDFFYTESLTPLSSTFGESWFNLDGTFGPVLDENHRMVADLDLQLVRYMGDYAGYTGGLSVTPKYEFTLDRWRMSLGVRLAALIYSEDYNLWPEESRHKSGFLFPDVHVDYHLLDDRLILQTSATGGDRFITLSDKFFSHPFSLGDYSHSTERIRAMIGARGQIASRFRYDFQGGYARWAHLPMEGYFGVNADGNLRYVPSLYEQSFNLLFAELDYGWKSDFLTIDGKLAYRWTDIEGYFDSNHGVFAPAAFTGFFRPAYNWGDRFKVGIDLAWSMGRRSTQLLGENNEVVCRVPGWVDLGLFAEYRFTHHFGFWAKGGNLLNQAVQRTPAHAEAGMYFTAGILLNF